MTDSTLIPLNSNNQRPYPAPVIGDGTGILPIDVPAFSSKWTSACTVEKISETTGFISGTFTSTAATNTDALGVVPVGFIFSGHRAAVKSVSTTFTPICVTASSTTGNITIDSVGSGVGSGDVIYLEFAYSIVG